MKTTRVLVIAVLSVLMFIPTARGQENTAETEKQLKDFQLSLFPFVGTGGIDSRNNKYKYSINLFAGVNGGVQGFELGGFMNINNGYVQGIQLAGFGNINNDFVQGIQMSGFMNVVNGKFEGFQGAGFMNVVRGHHNGIAGAGFMNVVNEDGSGIVFSGFSNIYKGDYMGIAVSGFGNIMDGKTDGITVAGFMNITKDNFSGVGTAGFMNIAGNDLIGIQLAGFMNIAENATGIQGSGFINIADKLNGLQIATINVTDTVESGLPIGFLSIVKKGGLKQLEFSASDFTYANLSFKIGVKEFYNIFSVGARPFIDEQFSTVGYGIGTDITLAEKTAMQVELHAAQIYEDMDWFEEDNTNFVQELRVMASHDLNPKVELFGGVSFYNHTRENDQDFMDVATWEMYDDTWDNGKIANTGWIGARAGLRLNLN